MKKLILFLILANFAAAQAPMGTPPEMDNREIETYRTMRLTEYLNLSPEQADKFFPRQRQHRDEMRKLHARMRDVAHSLDNEDGLIPEGLSSEDLQNLLKQIHELEDQENAMQKAYINEMQSYLEPYQVARYLNFEHNFRRELQKTMREKWKSMKDQRR